MPEPVAHPGSANAFNTGAPQSEEFPRPGDGGGNAFAMAAPGGGMPPDAAMGAPAAPQTPGGPTHEMTVSTMVHLGELERTFAKLLADPEIGKKNMRPKIYKAAADLLGQGFTTLPELMGELRTIPKDAPDQYRWIKQHFDNSRNAAAMVFSQHRAAFPGTGDWKTEAMNAPARDHSKHGESMAAVMSHYKKR